MQPLLRAFLVTMVLLLAGSPAAMAQDRAASPIDFSSVTIAIGELLNSPERLPLPLERIRPALKAHYITNDGSIYWIGTGRMTPFLQRIAAADSDGLNPEDYPVEALKQVREQVKGGDAYDAAQAELLFSAFFVNYAADLKIGRITPSKVDPKLFRNRKTIDVLRMLTELKKQRDPGKFLSAFESRNPHYQALKKMLGLYRAMAKSGGWPTIAQGANISPGGSDARIPQIRRILAMTGDYEGGGGGGASYDAATVAGMQKFQRRNGLEAKGLIGKQTLVALNIPPDERVKQIMPSTWSAGAGCPRGSAITISW